MKNIVNQSKSNRQPIVNHPEIPDSSKEMEEFEKLISDMLGQTYSLPDGFIEKLKQFITDKFIPRSESISKEEIEKDYLCKDCHSSDEACNGIQLLGNLGCDCKCHKLSKPKEKE